MCIADFIISKAGGISVTECIALNKPMIINKSESIPIPESYNIDFIERNELGIISNNKDLINDINELSFNSDEINRFKKNLKPFKIKNSYEIILAEINKNLK